jgi:hypothetical protein
VSVHELLEELNGHVTKFRDELAHVVTWQRFERGAAVVTELEDELKALGVPVGPLEAMTKGLVSVAEAVHAHVTAAATEDQRADLEAQLADIQARLDALPAPAVADQEPAGDQEPATAGKAGA